MPSYRRILSLWFPRIAVERVIRQKGNAPEAVMAVLRDTGNMQVIDSLTPAAEAAGLRLGQPLRDAMAMCPDLITRLGNPQQDAAFLATLQRWAGRFSPWISTEPPAGLIIDLTGCAHLFGGEAALIDRIEEDCSAFGLSVQAGIADTVGAAWALARFSGQVSGGSRSGDAIDQEARATRSRAAKRRHWERGGAAPKPDLASVSVTRISPPGKTRTALAKLPLASLRLAPDDVAALARLGLRRVEDLLGMPRAALSRRFGGAVLRRLDQALGLDPEPVSPARPVDHFAVRLTLPDPIGLESDILAAIDRLLPPLCEKLSQKARGIRKLRLQVFRTDETSQSIDVGLARPTAAPARVRPLLAMKLAEIDAGFGIDLVRLAVLISEPIQTHQHSGHMEAARAVCDQLSANTALDDLIGRLGARVGLESITRVHPAESHIPEKSAMTLAAAWSEPASQWKNAPVARPLFMMPPEPVFASDDPFPPETFRWRSRTLRRIAATGPERIAPEWWLDDPHWRTGVRDYWRVDVDSGARLWLYFAHGGTMSGGWFCQGEFA